MKRILTVVFAAILLLGMAGCTKKLVGTTITGVVLEHGLPVSKDFPGGVITVSGSGDSTETITLAPGEGGWKMACSPGQYSLQMVSASRVQGKSVDTNGGSQTVSLNFEEIVIYGNIQIDGVRLNATRAATRGIGAVTLELIKDGQIVDRKELSGSYEYQFVVPSGLYSLRAVFGTQKVEVPVNGTLSTQRIVDLARTAVIRGSVRELGMSPGTEWPGGSLRVENLDGVKVDEIPIVAGQDTYEIPVKAGIYRVIAESGGRQVGSGVIDLSEKDEGSFALNFDQVVLHGPLIADTPMTPGATLTISKAGTVVRKVSLLQGDTSYQVILAPDRYDLEIQVPSTGGLIREFADLSVRSRCFELNLHQKTMISGQVTENGLKPDPEAFPAGEVVFKTADGVVRGTAPLAEDGTFNAQVFTSNYTVAATSGGRTKSIAVDATRENKTVSLDYTDLVLTGTLKLNGQTLPSNFPIADVTLISPQVTKAAGAVSGAGAEFRAVVPKGMYTAQIKIRNTSVEANVGIDETLQRSTVKAVDIGNSIARISGQVSTPIGAPTCPVSIKLYQAGNSTLLASYNCDSSYRYEAYVNPRSYDIVIEAGGNVYDSRKYINIYVSGELSKDLAFQTVTITLGFNQDGGLTGDGVGYSCTYREYDDAFMNPLDDDLVVYRGNFSVPPFTSTQFRRTVHVKIGEPIYIFISHGFNGLCFHKKTVTPVQSGLSVILSI